IQSCALWDKVSPQQRLRALRIAISRDVGANERLPAHTLGERVSWIVIEGALEHQGKTLGPGAFVYPESLIQGSVAPDRDSLAITRSDLRGLVLRADDFNELCEDDPELAELLHETLGTLVSKRGGQKTHSEDDVEQDVARTPTLDPDKPQPVRSRAETSELAAPPPPIAPPLPITLPDEEIIPLTKPKPKLAVPVEEAPAVARTKTPLGAPPPPPPAKVVPPKAALKPPAIPIPKVVRSITPPQIVAIPPLKSAKPPEPASDVVDLGSELRADLGGDHAVPQRRASAPKVEARAPVKQPRISNADDEPEIEEVVEIEADPPPLAEADDDDSDEIEMTVVMGEETVLEDPGPDEPTADKLTQEHEEMTVSVEDDGARVTETVTDTSSQTMTVSVEEDVVPQKRPITANDTVVVSGTIKIPEDKPGPRSKRMSDGWED
ncbi:MAG: hypothetical protein M4D80_41885, partial [Myxococcota bacterium]|nr:hypothetical protein [Myxococcota bacterium]